MNKKIITALSAILLGAITLSSVGCTSKNTDGITPDYQGERTTVIQSLDDKFSFTSDIDDFGLTVAKKSIIGNGAPTDHYVLYDVANGSVVASSETDLAIQKLDEGLYYTVAETNGEDYYTLYHTGGATVSMRGSIEGKCFRQADTNIRYYMNVKGEYTEEKDVHMPVLTYDSGEPVGNYYGYGRYLFDENGKYVRTIDWRYDFEVQECEETIAAWAIGDALYLQTCYGLPDDTAKFDLYYNGAKCNICTYSYNMREDKVKKLDTFRYYVKDWHGTVNDSALLTVCKIENTRIGMPQLQAFNEKGKVSVDIQSVAPDATSVELHNGYAVFQTETGHSYVYQGKKLLHEHDIDGLTYCNNVAYCRVGNTLYLYDLKGEPLASYVNAETPIETANGGLYIQGEKAVYLWDTVAAEQIAEDATEVISTVVRGGNKPFIAVRTTETGTNKLLFLVGEKGNVPQAVENLESVAIVSQGYNEKEGKAYAIIKTSKDGKVSYSSIYTTFQYEK